MKKTASAPLAADPVDWFAQEILRTPERADDLKDLLRRRIGLRAEERGSLENSDPADAYDLWDNVPV